jgi:molecular chaperone DnaK
MRNTADSLVYQSEKAVKDFGDKVSTEEKSAIESAISDLKTALEGSDIEAIKQKTEALTQASQKLAEEMYKAQSEEQGAGADAAGAGDDDDASSNRQADDVEDADYEVVDDDK